MASPSFFQTHITQAGDVSTVISVDSMGKEIRLSSAASAGPHAMPRAPAVTFVHIMKVQMLISQA